MQIVFVNHPDIKEEESTKLFETKEKARVWLQKFREAENLLGTLSTPQEGVNPMTNTNLTLDDNSLPEGVKARYFPQKEVLIYQAEEDVMPVDEDAA